MLVIPIFLRSSVENNNILFKIDEFIFGGITYERFVLKNPRGAVMASVKESNKNLQVFDSLIQVMITDRDRPNA